MKSPIPRPVRWRATRASLTVLAAAALVVGSTAAFSAASASPAPGGGAVKNPYSPAYGHSYRHGVVPTRAAESRMHAWAQTQPPAASANDLNYGGGIDGIGVTTGAEKVYLVFYGSQWGTRAPTGAGTRR